MTDGTLETVLQRDRLVVAGALCARDSGMRTTISRKQQNPDTTPERITREYLRQ